MGDISADNIDLSAIMRRYVSGLLVFPNFYDSLYSARVILLSVRNRTGRTIYPKPYLA